MGRCGKTAAFCYLSSKTFQYGRDHALREIASEAVFRGPIFIEVSLRIAGDFVFAAKTKFWLL